MFPLVQVRGTLECTLARTHTHTHTHTRMDTHTSHLCYLDVTVHLVVQLVHLQLQQRESGDMSFRNKACSEATGGCLIDACGLKQTHHRPLLMLVEENTSLQC